MDVTRAGAEVGYEPPATPLSHTFPEGLVCGAGSPLVELRRTCLRVAVSEATVLLGGETGTGKEVFARLIHAASPRAKRQFVPVNCGAIPDTLLESELFGYVKGAFTGAVHPRRGRVALADGGTLFLDEIGELPLSLQVKLLRLLQERTYEPVGSSESVVADFRLVAATNRDLLQEVRAGRFRQDLYYRLNVCPMHLPALRQRRGDIPVLFRHFWRARGEQRRVEAEVLERLERYDWPGNVRELENLVERISVIIESPTIGVRNLPPPLGESPEGAFGEATPPPEPIAEEVRIAEPAPIEERADPTPPPSLALPVNLPALLRTLEEAYIARALAQTGGNKKEAARLLGMGRTTLVEKLRRRNAEAVTSRAPQS
jgi:sigma-54 dependent transcriptional regulator, flagellar regulatory protein